MLWEEAISWGVTGRGYILGCYLKRLYLGVLCEEAISWGVVDKSEEAISWGDLA